MASNSLQELRDIGVHDTAVIGVHDTALIVLRFSMGTLVTITLNRRACYGYDQRCEIFVIRGIVLVGNELSNTVVH